MTYVYRVVRIYKENGRMSYTAQTEWNTEVWATKELRRLEKRYQWWAFLVQRLEMCKVTEAA